MKKFKQFISRPVVIGLLFLMAVGLLMGTGIEGTRAVLNEQSSPFHATMSVDSINVALTENGIPVVDNGYRDDDGSSGKLSLPEIEGKLKLGYMYPEQIAASNTGEIPQFVRITIKKYWMTKENSKRVDLSPALIELKFNEDGWIKDEKSSTDEREVYYYASVLEPGQSTSDLTSTLSVSPKVMSEKTEENYSYNDLKFCLEASVDAVQNRHAEEAIKSTWGVTASMNGDGTRITAIQ